MLAQIGLLGAGGLAAALVFVPGLLPVVIAGAGVMLRCKPCLIALAVVAAFITGDIRRHRIDVAQCRAADIAMHVKAKERDAVIAQDTIQFQRQQVSELAAENDDLKKKVTDGEMAILATKGVACPLGADTARRLRDITR